jgi:hypothetical protein
MTYTTTLDLFFLNSFHFYYLSSIVHLRVTF